MSNALHSERDGYSRCNYKGWVDNSMKNHCFNMLTWDEILSPYKCLTDNRRSVTLSVKLYRKTPLLFLLPNLCSSLCGSSWDSDSQNNHSTLYTSVFTFIPHDLLYISYLINTQPCKGPLYHPGVWNLGLTEDDRHIWTRSIKFWTTESKG